MKLKHTLLAILLGFIYCILCFIQTPIKLTESQLINGDFRIRLDTKP